VISRSRTKTKTSDQSTEARSRYALFMDDVDIMDIMDKLDDNVNRLSSCLAKGIHRVHFRRAACREIAGQRGHCK
jgi:hypothetical protein